MSSQNERETEAFYRAEVTAEINRRAEALPGSEGEAWLSGRGFTAETVKRFRLGFNAENYSLAAEKAEPSILIPFPGEAFYITMPTTGNAPQMPKESIFNTAALYSGEACFVVESPLCAIAITQAGGEAVAIGASEKRLLRQLSEKPTAAVFVLALADAEQRAKIGAALEAIGADCVDGAALLMGEYSTPGEVLEKAGAEALEQAVKATAAEAVRQTKMAAAEAEAQRQQRTGAGMVDTFLNAVQTRQYEPIPTGITDIDKAIGGGFMRQQLVLLGAAPGAGKTALAQWIFEGMAARGTTSIFLNLEMSREQILARTLARITAKNGTPLRPNEVLQGYKWTDAQRDAVTKAAEEYKATTAGRIIYNPEEVTSSLDGILAYIEAEAMRARKAGVEAPCVVLDYLQIVTGDAREDAGGLVKRAVMGLKSYAVRHNAVVFVIMAHNRASNSTGAVSMESGRDSSALEYSADLQLAMTFTACLKRDGEKPKNPDELTAEERKAVTVRIVKGRFGGAGREVDLHFNGETMTYSQLANGWTPTNEPTPFTEPPAWTRKRF